MNDSLLHRRIVITSPEELRAILWKLQSGIGAGGLTQLNAAAAVMPPTNVADIPAEGPWPDIIHAEFEDRSGRRFRLSVETYHGTGGEWTPLDSCD